MTDQNLEFLKSKPEDDFFHRSRIMFCLINGKVYVGPKNIPESHIEWFRREGWLNDENAEDFLRENIRGFYLPDQNQLYCYRDIGFGFDDTVLPEVLAKIEEIKRVFCLNDETEIHLGPRDSPIYGKEYPRICVGKLKNIIRRK